ncbi:MAG TPA: NAD(P)-dependent oxidoreductase [Acidimicrobiales bacterium]|nr:NAD(P)-dependent oxidoreductase [Acidimicrobiales bacterium]
MTDGSREGLAHGTGGPVVVVEDVWGEAFDTLATTREVIREPDAWSDEDRLAELVAAASVLVVRNRTRVSRSLMEAAAKLQLVARAGVGLDNIDVPAADHLGIVVSAARGANARSVAEMALGLALAVARDITGHDRRTRTGGWQRSEGIELRGRCWGAVGLGATGLETVRLARAVGMHTAGFDPYAPADARLEGLDDRVPTLESLLAVADVVSLHVPLSSETAAMANDSFFGSMRPHAILINVGRGGLVDEPALLRALGSGRLEGAGLDVREAEPPTVGALEENPRVVLTPHVAGITSEAQERVAELLAADIEAVLDGRAAANAVGTWSQPSKEPAGAAPAGDVPGAAR